MLTLKSPFNDFIQLCAKAGACDTADAKAPLSTMSHADTGVGMPPSGTCAEGLKIYLEDKNMPEMWAEWVLITVGHELDEDCRRFFINKVTDPRKAINIHLRCPVLSDEEDKLLEAKFIKDGKHLFPTIEEELKVVKLKE